MNKRFKLTMQVGGKIRKIVACYFHAQAVKRGGCTCTIKAIFTHKECTYCEAIKIAEGK